jgi:hypothetical protein
MQNIVPQSAPCHNLPDIDIACDRPALCKILFRLPHPCQPHFPNIDIACHRHVLCKILFRNPHPCHNLPDIDIACHRPALCKILFRLPHPCHNLPNIDIAYHRHGLCKIVLLKGCSHHVVEDVLVIRLICLCRTRTRFTHQLLDTGQQTWLAFEWSPGIGGHWPSCCNSRSTHSKTVLLIETFHGSIYFYVLGI